MPGHLHASKVLSCDVVVADSSDVPLLEMSRTSETSRTSEASRTPETSETSGTSGTSALERLRGKLAQALDPRDPLSSLAPLIDRLGSARALAHGGGAARPPASGTGPRPLPAPAAAAPPAPSPLHPPEPLPTSVPALDELLAGGLPRGRLVELIGARSSGRFSTALAAIAAATAAGEAAALVDLGDGLDPQTAADLGVDLRRLLWLRPTTLKQALAGAEILLGGGFPMVVLDLGNPPVRGGRGLATAAAGWLRLARAAHAHGAALLVATPYRVSGTAAAAVLQAARGRACWQGMSGGPPWLLDGLSCRLTLAKCRGRLLPARPQGLELRLASLAPIPPAPTTPLAQTRPLAQTTPLAPTIPAAASSSGLPDREEPARPAVAAAAAGPPAPTTSLALTTPLAATTTGRRRRARRT